MKIIEVFIKNSKRHMLTGIKTIDYTPKKRYQMILGPNGSGKSSIFEVITSLVTNIPSMYNRDGGFRIKLSLNNKLYILTGGLELGNGFSFVVDGQELNDGKTMSVQKDLVFQHFRLTLVISDMMSAKKNFCDFKPQERKDWLTMLDKVDYELITKKYNRYKTDLRDMKGALKVTMQTTINRDELMSNEETTILKNKMDITFNKRNKLNLKRKEYFKRDYGILTENDLKDSNEKIGKLLDDVDPEANLSDLHIELSLLEYENAGYNGNLLKLEEARTEALKIDEVMSVDVGPLEEMIKQDELNIGKIRESNPYEMDLEDVCRNRQNFIELGEEVKYRIGRLPDPLEVDVDIIKKEMDILRNDLAILTESRMELEHTLKHYHSNIDITCPQCQHSFNPYGNKTEVEIELNKSRSMISRIVKEIDAKESLINTKTIWARDINVLQTMLEQPRIKDFTFHMYKVDDFIPTSKTSMINAIDRTIERLEGYDGILELIENLKSNKNKLDEMLLTKERLKESGITFDIGEIEKEIHALTKKRDNLESRIETVKIKMHMMEKLQKEINRTRSIRTDMYNKAQAGQDEIENKLLDDLIESMNKELESYNKQIESNDDLLRRIEEEDNRIDYYTREINDLTILVNSLSPAKGLIGVAIRQFLDGFLSNVNRIISDMWNYEVLIHPCKINDNGSMDYKFPVSINGIHALKDVSEGSAGMKDIFNLAFMLVSMDLLGMSNYPIFLDEFAVKMDPAHRGNAFRLLSSITKNHSNVFMISHYLDFYGGISDMDVSVLSQDNMDIEGMSNVNKVMTIKR